MIEVKPRTIELTLGHKDAKGAVHTRVTFGKRVVGSQLFPIDDDPQGANNTQYGDLVRRAAITEFGELQMPVPLKVLLDLDVIDRQDLAEAYEQFTASGFEVEGKAITPELVNEREVSLGPGYERNGLRYDRVEFGNRLRGYDEVEADRLGLKGVRRNCFFVGKQISRLYQSDGSSELVGPIALDVFERLDVLDIYTLIAGAEVWRESFRRPGARVQAERNGAKSPDPDDANEPKRERNPKLASGAVQ